MSARQLNPGVDIARLRRILGWYISLGFIGIVIAAVLQALKITERASLVVGVVAVSVLTITLMKPWKL